MCRAIVCPENARHSFVMSLFTIALVGTLLSIKPRQTRLVATGRDVNDDGRLLAWTVVERKLAERLGENLRMAIPGIGTGETTVMGGRGKGLGAVGGKVPRARGASCYWHIAQDAWQISWRCGRESRLADGV